MEAGIWIDSWEKDRRVTDFAPRLTKLCQKEGISIERVPLITGDIMFLSSSLEIIKIERKSTEGDLFSSSSARLQDQCLRLLDEADIPILLIDGPLYLSGGYFRTSRYRTGWRFSTVTHMLLSLQRRGLIIMYVPKQAETPREVISLYRYFQKTEHVSHLEMKLKPFPTTPKGLTPREKKIRTLMALKGVGPGLADRLLTVYGSVTGVGLAPLTGLEAIPGINRILAQSIKETLDGRAAKDH